MTRIVPSPQLLQHLSRLCSSDLKPCTSVTPLACQRKYRNTELDSRRLLSSSAVRRSASGEARTSAPISSIADAPKTDPQHASTPSLPNISSFYTLFPNTLAKGPPPQGRFDIRVPALRKEFLQLQSLHHPDKYTTNPTARQKAEALSSLLNNAYKSLSDPLLRAQYLLSYRYNVDVSTEDNTAYPTDQETLMEVMEAQEEIESAETQEEINTMKDQNLVRMKQTEKDMAEAFEKDDEKTATIETIRYKFWWSLQQALNDWEPGKEVRLVH